MDEKQLKLDPKKNVIYRFPLIAPLKKLVILFVNYHLIIEFYLKLERL